jgi:hypothetical protein
MARPIFASSVSFFPDISLPHLGQYSAPRPIVLPQPRQRFSRCCVGTMGGNGELPLASRLCCGEFGSRCPAPEGACYVFSPRSNKLAPSECGLGELGAKTTRKSTVSIRSFNKIRTPQRLVHQPIQNPRLNCWPNRLDQVERQAVAIRSVCVKNSEARIESASTGGQSTLALGHGVRVIEEAVRWID